MRGKTRTNCKSCGSPLDGYSPVYCKKCFNKMYLEWRSKNIEKCRERDRQQHRRRRAMGDGYKTNESRKYRKDNREKYRAQMILNKAIRMGRIKKSCCEICGSTDNIHGHHHNYSKPLEVRWLCPVHHKLVHQKIKPKRTCGNHQRKWNALTD